MADLDNYLNCFPAGRFSGKARERKQELAALARQWADGALWESACDSDDIGNLDQYLMAYPGGRHANETRARKQAMTARQREQAEKTLWARSRAVTRSRIYSPTCGATPPVLTLPRRGRDCRC